MSEELEGDVNEPEAEVNEATQAEESENEDAPQEPEEGEEEEAKSEDEESEDDEPKPKRRNRPGKTQRQLIRSQAQVEALTEMVRALTRQQGGQPAQGEKQQEASREPRQEDYQDYGQYLKDHATWVAQQTVQQTLQQERQRYQQSQRQQSQSQAQAQYQERLEEARDEYEDFDDVAFADDVSITETMANAIMESEMGPKVQYYLGSHPKEAAKIARMSAIGQVREIGKLEAKLSVAPPKKTTSATPPIKPVAGKGAAPKKVNPDDLSVEEWMKLERAGKLKY